MTGILEQDHTSIRNYRALMSCGAGDGWLDETQHQLASWLREKSLDVDVSGDIAFDIENINLRIQHHKDAQSRSLRARLVENNTAHGSWTTELIAYDHRGEGDWISLTVENDHGRFVAVPRLARYLMQALPLRDASVEFVDRPQIFREDNVGRLIDILCDEDRHGIVFVVGTADVGLPFEPFLRKMGDWAQQVYGLAQMIVLDPRATETFNREIGPTHVAPVWGIRTFLPGVDPASPVDSRRHRILGPARLGQQDDSWTRRFLGTIARAHAASLVAPIGVARLVRTFERLDNLALLRAIKTTDEVGTDTAIAIDEPVVPRPYEVDVADKVEQYYRQTELVKATLGISVIDVDSLRLIATRATRPHVDPSKLHLASARIEEQQIRLENIEDQLRAMELALDDDQLERALVYEDLERANAEIQWLREKLTAQGDYDAAFSILPDGHKEKYPESFRDLLIRLPELANNRIKFTGDKQAAVAVDDNDTLQLAVRTAWDVCLALDGYLRARDAGICDKGVDYYLRHTPGGYRGVTPGKHARTESKSTMASHGSERRFAVPPSVDSEGITVMKAHFKLAQIGMVSPRLYYLDDYADSGRIYIGYIGAHLTNTQTN